jgi:hypothetical protein
MEVHSGLFETKVHSFLLTAIMEVHSRLLSNTVHSILIICRMNFLTTY